MVTFTVITTGQPAPDPTRSESSATITLRTEAKPSAVAALKQGSKTLVVKFGGSSLRDKDRLGSAASLVAREVAKGTRVVVVVSAMGTTTDQLMNLINHDSKTPDKTDSDDVLAMGERTSVRVFATALKAQGVEAKYFDPSEPDWPIITDDNFSDANPLLELCLQKVRENVIPLLDWGAVPVIAGFVGRSTAGKVSTIGRGGSDTTAFIMAKGIGADEVVLVTDADGILSADPKLVPEARRLERIDVRTLIGLADSGTKFIHRKALRYKDPDIPVRVINNNKGDLEAEGTVITGGLSTEVEVTWEDSSQVMAITIAGKGISENPEILSEIIMEIRKHSSLDGLSENFNSLIFYVPQTGSSSILTAVHRVIMKFGEALAMAVQPNLAFLKVKGVGLEDTPGIIGRISSHLRENSINIYGMITIASSILMFVGWDDKETALRLMKQVVRGELQ
ncbi:MAG TPA: aspartate kinase [Candidatus Dormibacteraeota bacterium]|nr:aspartate kinase [Candidatus Dormibacteraeota bacterium]